MNDDQKKRLLADWLTDTAQLADLRAAVKRSNPAIETDDWFSGLLLRLEEAENKIIVAENKEL
ncbi:MULTISPECIES: hypothetical protein [unclassified Phyllobacterium]|uniref:hypothetical protein n=1 Tax=unclassified Phyllobacterium TaxID=2638441 RepID=UPI003012EF4D